MHTATRARYLKALLWGSTIGPSSYDELPSELQPVARFVDQIGDDLAEGRLILSPEDPLNDDPIIQAHLLAWTLARQVLPSDLDDLPDPTVVWLRSDLEGDRFDRDALNSALIFYASGGEPNIWRDERPLGRPSNKDVSAFQYVCQELVDTAGGGESFDLSPVTLVEDFVRMHWSNDPITGGLMIGWEESPLGIQCLRAVRAVRHLPPTPASVVLPDEPNFREPWRPIRT